MEHLIVSFVLILSILIYLIYGYIQIKKTKEHMIGSLVSPNYVPDTNMSFSTKLNDNIPPFNIDYRCQNNRLNTYLGFPCWWRKYASNQTDILNNQLLNNNTMIKNNMYPKNTPLKYDGIWNKEYSNKCNDYIWKL